MEPVSQSPQVGAEGRKPPVVELQCEVIIELFERMRAVGSRLIVNACLIECHTDQEVRTHQQQLRHETLVAGYVNERAELKLVLWQGWISCVASARVRRLRRIGGLLGQDRFLVRRECTDQVIVLGETHLRRIVSLYARYYNEARTHLSLAKDAPIHRPIECFGRIIAEPMVGSLHHRYARI
jgi:hypothetical protein